MDVLGVSAFGEGSAAALVRDGAVVAVAAEERFTRKRRDASFPRRAVRFCLREGGIDASALDAVVFHEKPLRRFERVLASQLAAFPRSARTFADELFTWLGDRLWVKGQIASEVGVATERVLFTEHHQAHAASAFYLSPFDEAAVLVVDGAGEWATTSMHKGGPGALEPLGELHFPHSLALFASAMAQYLGFAPDAEEHKLFELAGWGEPRFLEPLEKLVRVVPGGGIELDLEPFRFAFDGTRRFGPALEERLGPARAAGAPLRMSAPDSRDADVAASVQEVLGRTLVALARELHAKAPLEALCFGGSLARNPGLNARLLREGPFKKLFVPAEPGDAGNALGAALYVQHAARGIPRARVTEQVFLGEDPRAQEAPDEPVDGSEVARLADAERRIEALVAHLAAGRLVGLVRGRFEWGPRSLGHRSVLADPRELAVRSRLNLAVKRREEFRPFAPAVVRERAAEFFELVAGGEELARAKQIAVRVRREARARIPGAVHHDGTACVQVVEESRDPFFHRLLVRFGEASGVPVLLVAALNLRGDPLVRGATDALALFERSALDVLAIEERIYERVASAS